MTHFVRDTDYGCEMRSRFWLGMIETAIPTSRCRRPDRAQMRDADVNAEFARRLHQHCVEEMGYLAEFLPALYRRVTLDDTLSEQRSAPTASIDREKRRDIGGGIK